MTSISDRLQSGTYDGSVYSVISVFRDERAIEKCDETAQLNSSACAQLLARARKNRQDELLPTVTGACDCVATAAAGLSTVLGNLLLNYYGIIC